MTISRQKTAPDLVDVQIALSKLFGLTDEETARRVNTVDKPDGVSVRTVQNRLANSKAFINGVIEWALPLVRNQRESIEAITKEQLRGEYEKLRGQILSVRRAALNSEDLQLANKIADTLEDRLDGKAVSRMEMLASVEHSHTHSVSEESMRRFERLAEKLKFDIPQQLPALPPAENVIDV